MKSYQDTDPLHGHGKAVPKPKAPNSQTYVSRYFKESINPATIHPYREPVSRAQKSAQRKLWKNQQRLLEHAVSLR